MARYRNLTDREIEVLRAGGCRAQQWGLVRVCPEFDVSRITGVSFFGEVMIGENTGVVKIDGVERPCGLYNAAFSCCRIGKNVLIRNVRIPVGNYRIEDNVVIEDVSQLVCGEHAEFGNGVQVKALNEAGGREVTLYPELSAQLAYLQSLYKHDEEFQERLNALIHDSVKAVCRQGGVVAEGARIRSCGILRNVRIGPHAQLQGVLELENGTVLSGVEHPTKIGSGVIMKNFIVAEGAEVTGGAYVENSYVGQGVQAGKQLTAEHSLFFANSEAFQSEVCSVFAGPYTVTHHKSTLLIANLCSFFNAGSGTNQSNHMYKLGPVHQGILERGCKTGSYAYLMQECHIGPFTVVIGKHMANINIPAFVFSYLVEENGTSYLMPGINLFSTGTVRDDGKWQARDRRKITVPRDLVVFDVFSPYTVEKLRQGRRILRELSGRSSREQEAVLHGGVRIKRLWLRKGAKYYTMAIEVYVFGKLVSVLEDELARGSSWSTLTARFERYGRKSLNRPSEWVDVGGLIAPLERIETTMEDVREKRIDRIQVLAQRLQKMYASYREDELSYVCSVYEEEFGVHPRELRPEDALKIVERWESLAKTLNNLIVENTRSEFAARSMIGYAVDHGEEKRKDDFTAVRGTFEEHTVVKKILGEQDIIQRRAQRLKEQLACVGNAKSLRTNRGRKEIG
jgi:NDP-sugar pyrophosphorylase family protein